MLAEAQSGHITGTVTEGEEAGKTILCLPDAAGKEVAFLSTAAATSRQGGATGPQPLPGSGWPHAPPPTSPLPPSLLLLFLAFVIPAANHALVSVAEQRD